MQKCYWVLFSVMILLFPAPTHAEELDLSFRMVSIDNYIMPMTTIIGTPVVFFATLETYNPTDATISIFHPNGCGFTGNITYLDHTNWDRISRATCNEYGGYSDEIKPGYSTYNTSGWIVFRTKGITTAPDGDYSMIIRLYWGHILQDNLPITFSIAAGQITNQTPLFFDNGNATFPVSLPMASIVEVLLLFPILQRSIRNN